MTAHTRFLSLPENWNLNGSRGASGRPAHSHPGSPRARSRPTRLSSRARLRSSCASRSSTRQSARARQRWRETAFDIDRSKRGRESDRGAPSGVSLLRPHDGQLGPEGRPRVLRRRVRSADGRLPAPAGGPLGVADGRDSSSFGEDVESLLRAIAPSNPAPSTSCPPAPPYRCGP